MNDQGGTYSARTGMIEVAVRPLFLEDQSDPVAGRYVWAYHITLTNHCDDDTSPAARVQLKSRHWVITDALGRTEEVRGSGVVGEHPVLLCGDSYSYTSGVPLSTPSGIMRGSFQMVDAAGHGFDIEIPAFSLDCPYDAPSVN
ncbi:MAG: Co2+/Mg2+ efflux protein ApaG [Alphaproteobacteria bacterium]